MGTLAEQFKSEVDKTEFNLSDVTSLINTIRDSKITKTTKTHTTFKIILLNHIKKSGFIKYPTQTELNKHQDGYTTDSNYVTKWKTHSHDDLVLRVSGISYRIRAHFQNSVGSAMLKLGNELTFCADTDKPRLIVICDGDGIHKCNYITFLKTRARNFKNVEGLFSITEFKQWLSESGAFKAQ